MRPVVNALFLGVWLVPAFALAHSDYEETVSTIPGSRDLPLGIVLHYTDGIVVTDPVKLVLYDPTGSAVAETPYYRDVLAYANADGEVYVFGQDWWSVLFRRAWRIEHEDLVPAQSARCYVYALLAAVRAHWLGYVFTLALLVGGMWFSFSPRRPIRPVSRLGGALLSCGIIWLMLLFIYGRLSVTLIVSLGFLLTLPCWVRMLHSARGKRTPGGLLTKPT